MTLRNPGPAKFVLPAIALWLLAGAGALQAQFSGPALALPAQPGQIQTQTQTQTIDPAIINPGSRDLQIGPGDLLSIHLFGSIEFSPVVRVSNDGSVQLPLIGLVQIAGLTVNRAEDVIAQRLIDAGMYRNPQISIQITESVSQFVTVGGELHAVIPVNGDRRLLEVLAAAGSLPVTASHVITILRPGLDKPIVVDLGTDPYRSAQANIPILPRDTILISRVGVVYIVGAFKLQGAIPLQQTSPLTLLQATALSGGPGFEGRYNDLRIIRTNGTARTLVKVDIKKVIDGKAPDPILQADDIVFLPTNAVKAAIKGGGINAITGLGSLFVFALQATR